MPPIAEKPRRADARRNRERILAAGRELFAKRGTDAQMDEIATEAGVGIGTLYRNFPDKQALLTEMVRARFLEFVQFATAAEQIEDPLEAIEVLLGDSLAVIEGDVGFQVAMMGGQELESEGIAAEKDAFATAATRIIERAHAAGVVRGDLTFDDFTILLCGLTSTMYFKPGRADWRRHLELVLNGIRALPTPDRRHL
jgi:AcrR family transcriptional regulator